MEQEKNELIVADNVPKFEISLEANQERLGQLRKFIAEQMDEGIDYAPIPGTNGKPTLLKPGAEKLNNIFGFYPEFIQTEKILDHKEQFFLYEYKCVLKSKRNGIKQAEAYGSCNNKEKAKIGQDPYTLLNTINKIAQKRAYVAATLMATALSQKYTQDLEIEEEEIKSNPGPKKDTAGALLVCGKCGCEITMKVAEYSAQKFGRTLCFECQKLVKPVSQS